MKVVPLVSAPAASSARCAELLREAADAADRGDVRAVLIITLTPDREVMTGYETGDSFMTLVGAATVAIRDMIEDASE
jgi:hypothetical protein